MAAPAGPVPYYAWAYFHDVVKEARLKRNKKAPLTQIAQDTKDIWNALSQQDQLDFLQMYEARKHARKEAGQLRTRTRQCENIANKLINLAPEEKTPWLLSMLVKRLGKAKVCG